MESRQVRRAKWRKEAPMPTEFTKNGKRVARRWFARTYAKAMWLEREDEIEERMSGSTTIMEDA